jgi:hypothetical protein
MLAIGGIFGSICAAFFTQYLTPNKAFLLNSLFGVLIAIAGSRIKKEVD